MALQHTFSHLKATHFTAPSIVGEVSTSDKEQILQNLQPVPFDASRRSECLPGTRRVIIDSIIEWATSSPCEQRVLWLYGVAGSGKSALATTIAESLRKTGHLGAFLFFNRDMDERSHPAAVIRTMAYQLATVDQRIGTAIASVMKAVPAIARSSIISQFSILLAQPLSSVDALRNDEPLVIVVDGLDECGTADERSSVVAVLAEASAKLPSSVRIVVTSRPEADIALAFKSQSHIITRELDITTTDNTDDIRLYFRHRMAAIRTRSMHLRFEADWPGESVIDQLVKKASGLFLWASLASAFVSGYDPSKRIATVLNSHTYSGVESGLDGLYRTALESSGHWDDEDFVADFKSILEVVITAKNPITASAIDQLLSTLHGRPVVYTLSLLGSVLSMSPTVQVLHPSFIDFLTNRDRCGRDIWFIDRSSGNLRFSIACLRHLDKVLKYNIGNMTLSSKKANANFTEDISYACSFWVDHVVDVKSNVLLLEECLNSFLHKHLLHWFELFSIMKKPREMVATLHRLFEWVTKYCTWDPNLHTLLQDAIRFAQAFKGSFEEHPLLVYLAALPFTPTESHLYQTFHNCSFPSIPNGFHRSWPDLLGVLTGHEDIISSVVFSPDGCYIASASRDMTIRVWDANSGVEVLPPLEGHKKWVTSIAYCPNGSCLVSGSSDMTIRVWDTTSGTEVLSPLLGHTAGITSVACSSNGRCIASGSVDKTVHVWDAVVGEVLLTLCGHKASVTSVVFSPDGEWLVSASDDKTIHIWDAVIGTIHSVIQIHYAAVKSVNFSPDGKHIASASCDKTICVWDAHSGVEVFPPLHGHTAAVTWVGYSPDGSHIISCSRDKSIRIWNSQLGTKVFYILCDQDASFTSLALSPDGRHIVSSSNDEIIRIWDANPKNVAIQPRDHNGSVTAVAFSIGGEKVVSGGNDSTIRVWDVQSGKQICSPMQKHEAGITSLAFSPNGKYIVSGSYDKTIRLWDVEAALQILPPMHGHRTWIQSLVFSPDGTHIASSSYGRGICIWDTLKGTLIFEPLYRPESWIKSLAFSYDGKEIFSVSHDHSICMWNTTTGVFTSKIDQSVYLQHVKEPLIKQDFNGWIVESATHRRILKLPDMISVQNVVSVTSGSSIAIGTSSGRLIIMHIPFTIVHENRNNKF